MREKRYRGKPAIGLGRWRPLSNVVSAKWSIPARYCEPERQSCEHRSEQIPGKVRLTAVSPESADKMARGKDHNTVDNETDDIEDSSQNQNLKGNGPVLRVHELRKEREDKQGHLWIENVCQQALPKNPP